MDLPIDHGTLPGTPGVSGNPGSCGLNVAESRGDGAVIHDRCSQSVRVGRTPSPEHRRGGQGPPGGQVESESALLRVLQAYQAFANRVSHLKRKLDALKATLPDLDDSPIPSPSADAPSPTGSESPFHDMELGHPDLDASAMDDEAEPPAPSPLSSPGGSPKHAAAFDNDDNRMVEDMDLSEEEADGGIIGEPRGALELLRNSGSLNLSL